MAKRDLVTYAGAEGTKFATVNLSFRIGARCENQREDVLLLQTLFKYIGWSQGASKNNLGTDISSLPATTGILDGKTQQTIWNFQGKNRRHLLNVDGLIHPANYAGRSIKGPFPLMAIHLLNNMALDEALMKNDTAKDYIAGLIAMTPQLEPFLS